MFYKNAKFYRVTEELNLTDIENKLGDFGFRDCGSQELSTLGFSPVIGELMTHEANGILTFALSKQERLLPVAVVNKELSSRVATIESETGSPVGKKAQQDLKQEIIHTLLPQSFTKDSVTFGSYFKSSNLIAVNASSDSQAEVFLAMLRKAIGSLPIVPLFKIDLRHQLTDWIEDSPENFTVLEQAKFQSLVEEKPTASVNNQNLSSDEVQAHIDSGKLAIELGVEFDETLTCVIHSDGSVKKIKFSDVIKEQNDDIPKEQVLARFDANIALGLGELNRLAANLVDAFPKAA